MIPENPHHLPLFPVGDAKKPPPLPSAPFSVPKSKLRLTVVLSSGFNTKIRSQKWRQFPSAPGLKSSSCSVPWLPFTIKLVFSATAQLNWYPSVFPSLLSAKVSQPFTKYPVAVKLSNKG